ncbi:MAG: D-sedoheptulose 7-phosphate isomerase [Elusimicrobia bacterium]|nr:D-sedoheptulose 7-phosphate isomerase [Elusimicrobiota bacterium]
MGGRFQELIIAQLKESSDNLRLLADASPAIERAAQLLVESLRNKKKLVAFGNGGSAADAQHLTAELSGRFEKNRPALPAVALTTNSSAVTAIANDYSYKEIFSRQLENFIQEGDVVVAISTSGNSENVLEGAREAKKAGAVVIAWTGQGGGKLKALADVCLEVPSRRTSRIQEGHLAMLHVLCAIIEDELFPAVPKASGY